VETISSFCCFVLLRSSYSLSRLHNVRSNDARCVSGDGDLVDRQRLGFLLQSSQTRTASSQPRDLTGFLVAEHVSHTPFPQARQWWMAIFSLKVVAHTKHFSISLSGTQYSGRAKSFIHAIKYSRKKPNVSIKNYK
jgi:hypothetical protein